MRRVRRLQPNSHIMACKVKLSWVQIVTKTWVVDLHLAVVVT